MNRTIALFTHASLACVVVAALGRSADGAAIFADTFESGTPGTNVGAPWGKNDITVTQYQSAGNPFPTGNIYADLSDPANSASPSVALRLLSHGNSDNSAVALMDGQVTTFSFDFYEPTRAGDVNSVVFGYYHTGANVDLNSAGRNYSSTLHDGLLSPQSLLSGSGSATSYPLDTVNTVYMIANDTAASVVNYSGTGRTLAPTTADVWVSAGGGAPTFAFTLTRQNVGTNLAGIGFRTNNADIERVYVNNVLLVGGATFDRSLVPEPSTMAGLLVSSLLALAGRTRITSRGRATRA